MSLRKLSDKLQTFYNKITTDCVHFDENHRKQALHSLSSDPRLYEILKPVGKFIAEGVRISITHRNMEMLTYLLQMVQAMLQNSVLLEKYVICIHSSIKKVLFF